MSKKKLNIVLVIAVVALWGGVGYRIITRYSGTNPQVSFRQNTEREVFVSKFQVDSFDLIADYRDPFYGKLPTKKVVATKPVKQKRVTPKKVIEKKPSKPIDWSFIKYYGLNIKEGEKLGFIELNGKPYLVAAGDSANTIYIEAISKDSITVHYQNKTKGIKKL